MLRAYIDVETTGIERSKGAVIIEAGASIYHGTTEIASWSSLCNPGPKALTTFEADSALAVSGITPEEILAAPPTQEVAKAFLTFLTEFGPGAILHAYGVAFESKFLEIPPWGIPKDGWGECVMVAAMEAMGLHRFVKLGVAAAHFSLPPVIGHRALVDARTCAKIHQAILAGRDHA